jgi:hypothetical protein
MESEMVGIPAYCDECKIAFENNAISVPEGVGNISVIGNLTRCPKCGGAAKILDGTFSVEDAQLVAQQAPSWTLEILDRIRKIAHEASKDIPESGELLSRVESVSPELARALEPYAATNTGLVLLLMICFMLNSVKININVDFNELLRKAEAASASVADPIVEIKKMQPLVQVNINTIIEDNHSQCSGVERISKRQQRRIRGKPKGAHSSPDPRARGE